MFGLPSELVVTIPDTSSFYSLFADGIHARKTYLPETGETLLAYPEGAAVFLHYTYPAFRAVSLVRNEPGRAALPGLSKKVRLLFTVHASRVDKLRRAISFLNKHSDGAYRFGDAFYTRLYFTVRRRGKLSYPALRRIVQQATDIPVTT
ncbi:MAG: hypothetical protein LBC31_02440 [Treponema sp.]|jgi:hypothetical protein|nr:hypothetical protein [Treponema sp.]